MSNNPTKNHEPLFHIVKRSAMPKWQSWLVRIGSVIAALIVCGIVTVLLTGEDPIQVYVKMVDGAVGSERRLWMLAQNTAMLLCVALAVTPAFKMKFWNIGAEGQVLVGGLATATCMIFLGDKLSPAILMIVMVVVSIVAGAVWGLIPAFFKANWNTNETLFTLMMNYIAMCIVSYFSYEWSVPKGSGHIGVINDATETGWLPAIGGKAYLCNILIVAVLTVAMYVYLRYSKHGYEISVVGESENTAKYIGINVKKVIIRTMILSGALCGIAGFLLVSGTDHTVNRDTAGGRGFTAIMVSWLAKFNPLAMIFASVLLVFMDRGAEEVTSRLGLNSSYSEILTGIILFFIIGCEFFIQYKLVLNHKHKEVKA